MSPETKNNANISFFQKNKLWIAIFTLGVVFFVGALGFFVFTQNQNDQASEPEETVVETPQEPEEETTVRVDRAGEKLTDILKRAGIDLGFVSSENIQELGYPLPLKADPQFEEVDKDQAPDRVSLEEIVPAPQNPEKTSMLVWEEYGIEAPIIYAEFQDFYEPSTAGDGTVDFTRYVDNNPTDSPIQQKLQDGIVHLPISPLPGEQGNSYIIGHSSNYLSVQSDYNEVFKAIERTSKPGEEFYIYDHEGRELKFRVFEALAINEENVTEAYRNYGDKRVVTLQASILEQVGGEWLPTKRWLTRAELVQE
jgi:hypothetical protein